VIAGAIVALVVAVVLVVVLLKALGGGSPEAVTEDYLDAQWNSEFEDYCELQAKEYRESTLQSVEADDCADFAKKNDKEAADRSKEIEKEYGQTLDEVRDDFDRELEVTDVEEDGDKATVTYEEKIEYTGDNDDFVKAELGDTREETHEGSLELVKEDGDWKVSPPTSTTE
jgi:ketosteroid isomerase-like protein